MGVELEEEAAFESGEVGTERDGMGMVEEVGAMVAMVDAVLRGL
jgi:hypothetical protein